MRFNTIPEALEDLRQGKIILVTDDPERENEGDFTVRLTLRPQKCQFHGDPAGKV